MHYRKSLHEIRKNRKNLPRTVESGPLHFDRGPLGRNGFADSAVGYAAHGFRRIALVLFHFHTAHSPFGFYPGDPSQQNENAVCDPHIVCAYLSTLYGQLHWRVAADNRHIDL